MDWFKRYIQIKRSYGTKKMSGCKNSINGKVYLSLNTVSDLANFRIVVGLEFKLLATNLKEMKD